MAQLLGASGHLQHNANGYLRQSPALYAEIYTHAENFTAEEVANMRSKLDAYESYAKAVINFAQAIDKYVLSQNADELERNKPATMVARTKLEECVRRLK